MKERERMFDIDTERNEWESDGERVKEIERGQSMRSKKLLCITQSIMRGHCYKK